MQLLIHKENCTERIPRSKINSLFQTVFKKELKGKPKGIVNLIFTDDKMLKDLNKNYRNKNRATDVLSFNLDQPDTDEAVFGEIYISIDKAKEQAKDYNGTLSEEILRLVNHGFLHLLGYDHMNKDDETKMKAKEEFYLNKVYRS